MFSGKVGNRAISIECEMRVLSVVICDIVKLVRRVVRFEYIIDWVFMNKDRR